MLLTRLKAGAVALSALCTIASPTARAIARAQANSDDRRPFAAVAAVASASSQPPRNPAAGAAAKAEKPPAAGSDGVAQSKPRVLTPDGKLMYVNVYSTDNNVDQKSLCDFANVSILPEIKRIRGIGGATILGDRLFAMRVLLNPDRMRAYNVSSADVIKAISEQSMIGPPTRLNLATSLASRSKEYVLMYAGCENNKDKYKNFILKTGPPGEILRLKDVGEVKLGFQFSDIDSEVDGNPSAAIVLKQLPGRNAAIVIEAVKKDTPR